MEVGCNFYGWLCGCGVWWLGFWGWVKDLGGGGVVWGCCDRFS